MSKPYYQVATYSARSSVGYLARRSHNLLLNLMEPAFAHLGFTFTQYMVLCWLRDKVATNAKDICAELHHDSGALARVIDQLAERGFIERVRGTNDRRKVDLRLTAAGRDTLARLVPTVVDQLNSSLAEFSHEEIVELIRLLTKFNSGMEAKLSSPGADDE